MWATALLTATFGILAFAQRPTATAHNGRFVGTTSQLVPSATIVVNQFFGIPYAKKPKDYQRPQVADNETSIRNATEYGSPCQGVGGSGAPPIPALPDNKNVSAPQPHDCLFLNVYTPLNASPKSGLPVIFYIYGGGFGYGSSDSRFYDGSFLAGYQNLTVVTFNYRLLKFGWPGSASCNVPERDRNLGLIDTTMALNWVQLNIAAFGGDPKRVTVVGQSAGAMMADLITIQATHETVPFQAVILESGTYYIAGRIGQNKTAPDNKNETHASSTDHVTAVQGLDNSSIADIECAQDYSPRPVDDGDIMVPTNFHGYQVRKSGGGARVPMMSGSNAHEAIIFLIDTTTGAPQDMSWDILFDDYPELRQNRDNITEMYESSVPCNADVTRVTCEWYRVSAAITDFIYTCPSARGARANAENGVPTWRYSYNTTYGGYSWGNFSLHGFEVPQVFGTYDPNTATAAQKSISKVIMAAWADFARDPQHGPGWDQFTADDSAMVGHLGPTKDAGVLQQQPAGRTDYACSLFESVYEANDPSPGQ